MGPLQVFVCKPYESIKAWKTCRNSEAGSHSFIETVCGFEAHQGSTHQEPFEIANLKKIDLKLIKDYHENVRLILQDSSLKEKILFCKQGYHSLKVFADCFSETLKPEKGIRVTSVNTA